MSADRDHSLGRPAQDHALDWEMADLPAPEEPGWYADDALAIDEPARGTRETDEPARGTRETDEPDWGTPDHHDPDRESPDLNDPSDEGSPQGAPFADGGWADALAPDPVLATLVDLVQRDGLEKLDDDQLTGVLQAANRLAAWSASVRVAAVSGLAARREAEGRKSGDWRPFDHVDDEVAVALTLTRRSGGRLVELALALDRLPRTRAALAAGLIDERRAEVIAEELAGLDDEHAAAVEALIIGKAPRLTSGQLRALVRRAVLSADPAAARRRKEKALKDARVEMFPETSGTAALSGRDLPPAAALAADKHLTALAQALKATGIPGTLDTLRARAYLHLLTGQPAATLILPTATPGPPGRDPRPGPGTSPAPGSTAPGSTTPGSTTPGSTTPGSTAPGSAGPGSAGPGRTLPGLSGSVNLTMPLAAWLGWTESPGDVPGYGPVDAERLPRPRRPARPRTPEPVVRHPHQPRRASRRPRLRPPRPPRPTPAPGHPPRTTRPPQTSRTRETTRTRPAPTQSAPRRP